MWRAAARTRGGHTQGSRARLPFPHSRLRFTLKAGSKLAVRFRDGFTIALQWAGPRLKADRLVPLLAERGQGVGAAGRGRRLEELQEDLVDTDLRHHGGAASMPRIPARGCQNQALQRQSTHDDENETTRPASSRPDIGFGIPLSCTLVKLDCKFGGAKQQKHGSRFSFLSATGSVYDATEGCGRAAVAAVPVTKVGADIARGGGELPV